MVDTCQECGKYHHSYEIHKPILIDTFGYMTNLFENSELSLKVTLCIYKILWWFEDMVDTDHNGTKQHTDVHNLGPRIFDTSFRTYVEVANLVFGDLVLYHKSIRSLEVFHVTRSSFYIVDNPI